MFKKAEALEVKAKSERGSSKTAENYFQGVHDALYYLEKQYSEYFNKDVVVCKLKIKVDEAIHNETLPWSYIQGMIDCLQEEIDN